MPIQKHLILSLFAVLALFSNGKSQTVEVEKLEIFGIRDSANFNVLQDKALYAEGWDTLAQPKFWRLLMNLSKDSAVLNIGSTREIIEYINLDAWNKLTELQKENYRDSVRKARGLSDSEKLYLTSGKSHYYEFEKAIPSIHRAIPLFEKEYVDAWYAQAILLIESPGKLYERSPVGALGSFQLMKSVAIKMGLTVNRSVDERKDFDKSAVAAAKLIRTICLPETNKILDDLCVEYDKNDLWYKLLVLHVYHAGAYNVKKALHVIQPTKGDMALIQTLWKTEAGSFRNASQNYSQIALASLLELDTLINKKFVVSN